MTERQSTENQPPPQLSVNGPILAKIQGEVERLVSDVMFAATDGPLYDANEARTQYGQFFRTYGEILNQFLRMNGVQKLAAVHMDAGGLIDQAAIVRDIIILFAGVVIATYKEGELETLLESFAGDVRTQVAKMVEQRDANLPKV